MIGIDVLLSATLGAFLRVLAKAGFEKEAEAFKERLLRSDERKKKKAFKKAFDKASECIQDQRLKSFMNQKPFLEAVITGLLDPMNGFDLKAAGEKWAGRLENHAPSIRRFFSALERALAVDETWGPILERYQELHFRQDILEELRRKNMDIPVKELVSNLYVQLEGSGAVAVGDGAVAAGEGGTAIGGNVVGDIINQVVNQFFVDRMEISVPQHGPGQKALRRAYLNRVFESTRNLPLPGVGARATSETDERIRLDSVYTALLTTSAELDESMTDKQRGDREVRRISALQQLNGVKRLVLLGDPGSGKSTFVSFVTMCLAGEALGNELINLRLMKAPLPDEEGNDQEEFQPWEWGPLLPVRVILRDFAAKCLKGKTCKANAETLWEFIVGDLKGATLGDYEQHLRKELMETGGILLLDGLDEVPEGDNLRLQIKNVVEDFTKTFSLTRVLITSRTYAYKNQGWRLADFEEARLASFSAGQIRRFVDRWYDHAAEARDLNRSDAKGNAVLLKRAIFGNERLMEMAERPLLLTLMASLHAWRGGSLPEKREELYWATVELLLDLWEQPKRVKDEWGNIILEQPSLSEWLKVNKDSVREFLDRLAFDAHDRQLELTGTADVSGGELLSGLMAMSQNPDAKLERLVEYLSARAGLLLPKGQGVYTFPHRSIQEYLAACHLTKRDFPDRIAGLVLDDSDRWQEVALLAGAKAAKGSPFAAWALVDALCHEDPGESRDLKRNAWGAQLAGRIIVESVGTGRVEERNQIKLARVKTWLVHILEKELLETMERAAAGNTLARLGDPRFDPNAWYLPKGDLLGFIEVPEGHFHMGSDKVKDKDAYDDELPQHKVDLKKYYIGKYPVTVAQFRVFVKDSGHKPQDEDCLKGTDNHPVALVTWNDAVAYCNWLTELLRVSNKTPVWLKENLGKRWVVRLPTEPEWEKAARGTDGRIFPWGNEPDPNRSNYNETGINATSTVGCFPGGESPYGALDMSGNVWEWCRTKWQDNYRNYDPWLVPEKGGDSAVLRGGAFYHYLWVVRCADRHRGDLRGRGSSVGFRVVFAPDKPSDL